MILQKSFQYANLVLKKLLLLLLLYYIFVDTYVETDTFLKIQWKKTFIWNKNLCNIVYCKFWSI